MELMSSVSQHTMNIDNRQKANITGIKKVISVDTDLIVVITDAGKISIKGQDLHANHLDVDSGKMEFTGIINNINYTDYKTSGQKAAGFVGRLFK